jgi:FKBP-type peptidyl-prolyl cis-trans isomerase FkpA
MNRKITLACILAVFAFALGSCSTDDPFDPYEQWKKDVQTIDNHLAANNITDVLKHASGVRIVIDELGTGLPAAPHQSVDIDYTGTLLSNGVQFDHGNTSQLLNSYIQGWQVAMSTLPEGSKATIYIPSTLGYGNVARNGIPANSNLVFEIDFRDVVMATSEKNRFTSDTTAIEQYLDIKGITATKHPTGVRYVVSSIGTGTPPGIFDAVKVKYSFSTLADDTHVIATVTDAPTATFDSRVVDFIPGMVAGLQTIGVGGKVTLYIPSHLAFGIPGVIDSGQQIIAPNSNMIVEVELQEIIP